MRAQCVVQLMLAPACRQFVCLDCGSAAPQSQAVEAPQKAAQKVDCDFGLAASCNPRIAELSQKSQQSLSQDRSPRFGRLPAIEATVAHSASVAEIATIAVARP